MNYFLEPWPWYIAGPLIGLVMLAMQYLGKTFGFSSNLRTMCAYLGAGKKISFFNYDYKAQRWNLVFLLGTLVGAFIAGNYLMSDGTVQISKQTSDALSSYGIQDPGAAYAPAAIFSSSQLRKPSMILLLLAGGIMVGFGTRYAGGCTSGHAITGLSNLQIPSLIAVVGFFIGGLIMTFFILPNILPYLI